MTDDCPHCHGAKTFRVDDLRVRQCICVHLEKMRTHLGSEIARAEVIKSSPLYNPDGSVDLTKKNLYIQSSWSALVPHLKYSLTGKGLDFYFTVVTDERMKDVFVGSESYKSRAMNVREDMVSFNSLPDLIGESYDLAIIKLGWLGHANRAAAGCLKEALMIREHLRKPTWLVDSPDRSWAGTPSYNLDVENYINRHDFQLIEFDSTNHQDGDGQYNTPGMSVEEHAEEPPSEEGALNPNFGEPDFSSSDSGQSLMDDDLVSDKKKFKKSKWSKR